MRATCGHSFRHSLRVVGARHFYRLWHRLDCFALWCTRRCCRWSHRRVLLRFYFPPATPLGIRKAQPQTSSRTSNVHPLTKRPMADPMNAKQALAWVTECGVAVESVRASVPSLAQMVTGEPLRGSWWAHPKRNDIFRLSRAIRSSPDVLVCRLVDGKITYVHRRLWPALVALAGRFSKGRLAAVKEVHTPAGKHKLLVTPFPKWVPKEILRVSKNLTQKEAASQLAFLL